MGGGRTTDCVVTNMSISGVRVECVVDQAIGDQVELLIHAEQLIYPAIIMWINDHAVGLRFIDQPRLSEQLKMDIEKLEREAH